MINLTSINHLRRKNINFLEKSFYKQKTMNNSILNRTIISRIEDTYLSVEILSFFAFLAIVITLPTILFIFQDKTCLNKINYLLFVIDQSKTSVVLHRISSFSRTVFAS